MAVGEYESQLAAFHRSLAASPPPGLLRSAAFRVVGAPWLEGGRGYEDWYLVDDWPALGHLEEGAVSGSRRGPHDAVARLAGNGAGGVYASFRPAAEPLAGEAALWLGKPHGAAYDSFRSQLETAVPARSPIWQRKMTLGPSPEFCVTGEPEGMEEAARALEGRATIVLRQRVWP